MKNHLIYIICIAVSLFIACKKQDQVIEDTTEFELLESNYGGNYEILSSIASDSVDLDLDGNKNTNIFKEIPLLEQSKVIIRVLEDNDPRSTKNYTTSFELLYPEQYALVEGREISSYTPGAEVIFLYQPIFSRCLIDTVKKLISLLPENNPHETERRFTRPNEIKLLDDEKIQVSILKEFYTKQGWTKINITSIYKKENT